MEQSHVAEPDWVAITKRNARSVQTTIGWIFWDPGAVARFEALGPARPARLHRRPGRAARPGRARRRDRGVRLDLPARHPHGVRCWPRRRASAGTTCGGARDEAVLEGLAEHAPAILEPLARLGPDLWPVVDALPTVGRPFFASHLRMPRPEDPVLSGWHAVNCIREWRGDTHWALVAAAGLTGVEASIVHNAWLGYEPDWLPNSRGTDPADLDAAWTSLEAKGLAADRAVRPEGVALRQQLEDDTDRRTTEVWERLGEEASIRFAEDFEPPCELLLAARRRHRRPQLPARPVPPAVASAAWPP